jgi:hypothetical protein
MGLNKGSPPSPHLWTEICPVSEVFYFLVSRIPDDEQRPETRNSEFYIPPPEPFRFYIVKTNSVFISYFVA